MKLKFALWTSVAMGTAIAQQLLISPQNTSLTINQIRTVIPTADSLFFNLANGSRQAYPLNGSRWYFQSTPITNSSSSTTSSTGTGSSSSTDIASSSAESTGSSSSTETTGTGTGSSSSTVQVDANTPTSAPMEQYTISIVGEKLSIQSPAPLEAQLFGINGQMLNSTPAATKHWDAILSSHQPAVLRIKSSTSTKQYLIQGK